MHNLIITPTLTYYNVLHFIGHNSLSIDAREYINVNHIQNKKEQLRNGFFMYQVLNAITLVNNKETKKQLSYLDFD